MIYASNKYLVKVTSIFLQTRMLYSGRGGEILGLFLTKNLLQIRSDKIFHISQRRYFAKCATKSFRNMNTIFNTPYRILMS